jgi:hypothetical protein
MENGRRRHKFGARRLGIPMMPLIDENVPPIEKVDLAITWWEDERLRNMHLAAMRSTARLFQMWDRFDVSYDQREEEFVYDPDWTDQNLHKYLSNSLRCNIELNELFRQRNEIAEIAKRHASESLMRFYLRHPVFKNKDLRPVLRLIFQFACTPGYALVSRNIVPWLPNAAARRRELTVEELFYDELLSPSPKVLWDRKITEHYRYVVPHLHF